MPKEIETLVTFFKALADATRLRIIGLLAVEERTVDELSMLVDVRPPTVSHHLAKLKALGLVSSRQDGVRRWYRLEAEAVESFAQEVLASDGLSTLGDEVEATAGSANELKIMRTFMEGDRITKLPAKWSKKKVLLRYIFQQLDAETVYSERALNEAIEPVYHDYVTARRLMVDLGWLTRDRAGREYRVVT